MTKARDFSDLAECWNGTALTLPAGTSGAPSYSFKGDAATGFYSKSAGVIGATGTISGTSFVGSNADNWRITQGNYGVFWRQDGSTLYLMLTNSGDPNGSWNNLRPFNVNLADGRVDIASSGLNINNWVNIWGDAHVKDRTLYVERQSDFNGYATQIGAGSMEMWCYDTGAYIDFKQVSTQDYLWRVQLQQNGGALNFLANGGQYIQLLSDGNIWCNGRGYVWDAINGKCGFRGLSVEWQWTGTAGNLDMIINNDVVRHIWYSDDNRIRSPISVGWNGTRNYCACKLDTDGGNNQGWDLNPSDERLKENIQPAGDALSLIRALNVVSFDWKDTPMTPGGGHVNFGIVAQPSRTVLPQIAYQVDPADPESFFMQDIQNTVNPLLRAVQQMADTIDELKAKIAALEAKVTP